MFLSVGADGTLLWWDVRKAHEAPEEKPDDKGKKKPEGWGLHAKMAISNPDGAMELSPVYAYLDVDEDVTGPASVYTVTEEGEFTTIHLSNPQIENFSKGVCSVIPGHYGPCVALQRSPFVAGVHLSVGDWTFNIWERGDHLAALLVAILLNIVHMRCVVGLEAGRSIHRAVGRHGGHLGPTRPIARAVDDGRGHSGGSDEHGVPGEHDAPTARGRRRPGHGARHGGAAESARGGEREDVCGQLLPRGRRSAWSTSRGGAYSEIKEAGGGGGGGEEKKEAPAEVKEGEATEEETGGGGSRSRWRRSSSLIWGCCSTRMANLL